MSKHLKKYLEESLGLDLNDPNLKDTAIRMNKMFKKELLCNTFTEFEGFTTFPNSRKYNQIVGLERIDFVSVCSHHMIPFHGKAWFYYIPNELLIGASKPVRCIIHYSKKPQLQEELGHEVITQFVKYIQPKGAMIYMSASHGCMSLRGVKQPNMLMSTSVVEGIFKTEKELELKALQMIQISLLNNR